MTTTPVLEPKNPPPHWGPEPAITVTLTRPCNIRGTRFEKGDRVRVASWEGVAIFQAHRCEADGELAEFFERKNIDPEKLRQV
jgi:hypothetical protein